MTLPADAIIRATDPLVERAASLRRSRLPPRSSLPLSSGVVARYSAEATRLISAQGSVHHRVPAPDSWAMIEEWVREADAAARGVADLVTALAPFDAFGPHVAATAIRRTAGLLDAAVAQIRAAPRSRTHEDAPTETPYGGDEPTGLRPDAADQDRVRWAFGLDEDAFVGSEFEPHRIVRHFAHRPASLIRRLRPHLLALGLPPVRDPLTAVCIVGWIVVAPDPVVAANVLRHGSGLFLSKEGDEVALSVLRAVRARDNATSQLDRQLRLSLSSARALHRREDQAHQLVDAYRRVLEGPIRHGGWFMRCLDANEFRPVPMLSEVRDAMTKRGGQLAAIAAHVVLSDLRNGQVHETLEWDGARSTYLSEGEAVTESRFAHALEVGLSFDRGWSASVAFARDRDDTVGDAWDADGTLDGGAPRWVRAQAAFASNEIDLDDLEITPEGTVARISTLTRATINPCLQTLLWARLLLEPSQTYRVLRSGSDGVLVDVDGDALDRTMPVWSEARRHFVSGLFDSLPLSTFLPANHNARTRHESGSKATQAAAWIALDDLLDAINSPPRGHPDRRLDQLAARFRLAALALEAIDIPESRKVRAARAAIQDLCTEAELAQHRNDRRFNDGSEAVRRVRDLWSAWGPVSRMPGVA